MSVYVFFFSFVVVCQECILIDAIMVKMKVVAGFANHDRFESLTDERKK